MFQKKVVEKVKTHILCWTTFCFRKLCRLWDIWKSVVQRGRPHYRMVHVPCIRRT